MGGKAFNHLAPSVRLPTPRFAPLVEILSASVGGQAVRWLRDKPDHGDADIVVPTSIVSALGDEALAERVAASVRRPHVMRRPNSYDPILFVGLELPEGLFQVDLIGSPDELVDFALGVLSWGDIGTMAGRVAREMGLTFGQNGLRIPVRVPDAPVASVLLTADFDAALDVMGLDAAAHRAGFDDQGASVDWLAAGRFFDPKIFDPARTTSEARRRGRQRAARPSLVEDIMSRPIRHEWPAERGPNPLQERFAAEAVRRFGREDEVAAQIEDLRAKAAVRRAPSAFTMEAIAQATGFTTPHDLRAIGSIIGEDFPGSNAFPNWKAVATPEDVAARAKAAMPILAHRRAERARRLLIEEQNQRNRAAKLERRSRSQ